MGMSNLVFVTLHNNCRDQHHRPTEITMSTSEERVISAAGQETVASNRCEEFPAVRSCPHDQSRKTARVALPRAEDAEPEVSDNEVDEGHIEDDAEDGDFLADFPDNTEVRSYSPDVMARWTWHWYAVMQELDLVHSRLKDLDNLRLERFADHLKKLCLRTNYISKLDPRTFHALTMLEELDLYDNRIANGKRRKKDESEADGIKDALDNMAKLS